MGSRFNASEAAFLARAARNGPTVTYGEFANEFGGLARGQGRKLTDMAARLHDNGLPLLPVLVMNAETGLPSKDASIYESFGLLNEADLSAEQDRCFAWDWTKEPFWKDTA